MDEDDGDRLTIELPGGRLARPRRVRGPGRGPVPGLPWHIQIAADAGMDVRAGAADRGRGADDRRGPARLRAEHGAVGDRIFGLARAVAALADHLGLGRFAVLAHSLGSAFALACGPALGDRLAVIVIASGMGPLRPGERFHSGNRAEDLYWRLARRRATWLLNRLFALSGTIVLRSARGDPQRFAQGMVRRLPD